MERAELLYSFLLACAKNDCDEVDHLLELITEELNEGEGCFGRDEIVDAMHMLRAEFASWDDDEDYGTAIDDLDDFDDDDDLRTLTIYNSSDDF